MRLSITGIGLVTAVGRGAAGSCASLRAGTGIPQEILGAEVDGGEGEMSKAVGYPTGYANGFFQTGAWVRLADIAVEDLCHRLGILPGAREIWSRAAVIALAPAIVEERFGWDEEELPTGLRESFAEQLVGSSGISVPPAQVRALGAGHCALAHGLRQAEQLLGQRHADRVLLAAADSYLDGPSIAWLAHSRRLKGPERPVGIMPGEAGAALLVETDLSARLRKAEALGYVEAIAVGAVPSPKAGAKSPPPQPSSSPPGETVPPPMPAAAPLGRALAEAIRNVLPPVQGGAKFQGDLYLDLNGENWKASAWGHAQVQLVRYVDFDRCRTFVPAESLGETGAASAGVAAAFALYNFHKDRSQRALVLSISNDGSVAAIRLSPPG
jgi:3-oxoacyl-[acyl-carrier-protein] synthase-1